MRDRHSFARVAAVSAGILEDKTPMQQFAPSAFRVTAGEHAAETILAPALARLLPDYPDINVEIVVDYGLADIVAEHHDADVRRRAGREGYDYGAHRTGHAHGCRWITCLFRATCSRRFTKQM